ncbi:MAG TPA: hypothetical protein DDZ05_02100 [Candidatus Blackburnbacteria bacterium]|nr:hypothetical protein [Candidatus Blackburnbacteria bacterium]
MNLKESGLVLSSTCESELADVAQVDVIYSTALPSKERRRYMNWATCVALDAFGRQDPAEFRKSVLAVLQNHSVVFLLKGDLPFAFISTYCFKAESMGVMYIEGMAVKKDYQGNGVANKLVETAFDITCKKGLKIDFIAGKTQNPAVAKSRMNYCREVYPIFAQPTPLVLKIVNMVRGKKRRVEVFDEELLVERNSYNGLLNTNRSYTSNEIVNRFFDEHVGERDYVFIVGKI